ncbi:MAG: ABC transporter substrate-binding protein, partial [bacterium]|nr:ABC transporter substrate-binding protein [bacterium]
MRNEKSKKTATAWLLATALVAGLPQLASAETVLRIGMTAADIPRTLGQPDQGFEGNRFTGLTMYDALTMWDLSSVSKPSVMIPGLSTEWKVDDADKKKWVFKLRPGVTFHDGAPFNADAVVWNVDKVLKSDAPQFDASQVGVTASRMPTLASAKKIDDMTVELTTKEPDSFLPINLTNLFIASPAKWQKLFETAEGADAKAKSQAAWAGFARDASGTGPWKMSKFTPRERLELV